MAADQEANRQEEQQEEGQQEEQQPDVEILVRMTMNTKAAVLRAAREHQEQLKGEVDRLNELMNDEEDRPLIKARLVISQLELEELQRGISQLWHARNHKGILR